jgi:hypothetical protein
LRIKGDSVVSVCKATPDCRIHRVLATLLLFSLLPPAIFSSKAQNQPLRVVSLVPFVSLQNLGTSQGIGSHMAFGVVALYSVSSQVSIGLGAEYASPTAAFDLIGSSGEMSINSSHYQLIVTTRLGRPWDLLEVSMLGGLGMITLSTEEANISAGALGMLKVPAQSDRSMTMLLGVVGSREIIPRVSIFLQPRALALFPLQTSSIGYSLSGGISLGLL